MLSLKVRVPLLYYTAGARTFVRSFLECCRNLLVTGFILFVMDCCCCCCCYYESVEGIPARKTMRMIRVWRTLKDSCSFPIQSEIYYAFNGLLKWVLEGMKNKKSNKFYFTLKQKWKWRMMLFILRMYLLASTLKQYCVVIFFKLIMMKHF